MNEEKRTPTREQVLEAIHHARDKATVRAAQRMVRQWLEVNPDDTEIIQASSTLTVAATALLSGTVPPYHSTDPAPLAPTPAAGNAEVQSESPSPHGAPEVTPATSGTMPAPPGADMALRLIEHLEKENAFLRAQVEEANRNAAELRAALREAQRICAKDLSSSEDASSG